MQNRKIRIDEHTIWEETGNVRVYNYPPKHNTQPYICKVYREYKQDITGAIDFTREVKGNPISFNSLFSPYLSLATVIGEAQVILNNHIENPVEWSK